MRVRKVIAEKDIPLERAIDFLKENKKYGIVLDSTGTELKLEELEDVKDFGSNPGSEPNSEPSRGREISEDTYSELLEIIRDKTEPSPECDS